MAQDFDQTISTTADTLAKKIISSKRNTVAITDFINLDGSITQLGTFLSEEISSELSNLTNDQTAFRVLERSKLDQIAKEKNLIQSTDGSKMATELGKLDVADVLIFATITDFNGYYRVVIKLLDTKNGDALSSWKASFVKSPSLENLNSQVVKAANVVAEPQTKTSYVPAIPKKEVTSEANGCEGKVGTLNITNKASVNGFNIAKIVIRVAKSVSPNNDDDYYYITIEENESKPVLGLEEGIYIYEAKVFDPTYPKGWSGFGQNVSSGQVQITGCKTSELIVR